jgi:DNA polymerase-3 subunit alpha
MQESKNKIFNQFKVHTQYSICEGAVKIEDLKNYCKDNKIRCVGLSDTSNLFGALEFSESLSKCGTQPIIGTQIIFNYKNELGLLPLIAKNEIGYKKIIELSSKSYLEQDNLSEPNCDFNDLLTNAEGIIILSGTINGLIGKLFNKGKIKESEEIYKLLKDQFKDNFYIEIQRHEDQNEKSFENFNLSLSNKFNIPIMASHEVFYLNKSMHDAHEALICIGSKTYLNDKNRIKLSNQHYFKSNEEMKSVFFDLPEALENNYN